MLLEASDGVGGRVRTDIVDGFTLDRGFAIFLTSYPETQVSCVQVVSCGGPQQRPSEHHVPASCLQESHRCVAERHWPTVHESQPGYASH